MRIWNLLLASLFVVGLAFSVAACDPDPEPEPGLCQVHEDCAQDEVCHFGTENGCLASCTDTNDCAAGYECDTCATGSCPACDDCVAACVPAP